ncbi:MAG: hypothetical protein LJE67_11590, partial [Salaquimonas sp.]|nr:hypothetical protein [Salaquimonas sp.]
AIAYGGYEAEEAEARKARRGMWAFKFERPSDWRRRHGHAGDAGKIGGGLREWAWSALTALVDWLTSWFDWL